MPLPELPITDPEEFLYTTEIEHQTLKAMLAAIADGVTELGVGECEVEATDNARLRRLGFTLRSRRGQFTREWLFFVRLTNLKDDPSPLRHLLKTVEGRASLATRLQEGRKAPTIFPAGV